MDKKNIEPIKFVVIMATYHRSNGSTFELIKRALISLKQQVYTKWDMILISDKYEPTDEFQKIIDFFDQLQGTKKISDNKLYPLYNTNVARENINDKKKLWCVAAAGSINMGLRKAREMGYKYYCRLDDDDYWHRNHLFDFNMVFSLYPECVFAYSQSRYGNAVLPDMTIKEICNNNLMLGGGKLIHSSMCFRIDIIQYTYFTTFNEKNIGLPTDFIMWEAIKNYISMNPQYTCIYIPNLTCFHETEGSSR